MEVAGFIVADTFIESVSLLVSRTVYDIIIPFLSRSGGGIHKMLASVSDVIKNWTSVGLADGAKTLGKVECT